MEPPNTDTGTLLATAQVPQNSRYVPFARFFDLAPHASPALRSGRVREPIAAASIDLRLPAVKEVRGSGRPPSPAGPWPANQAGCPS